MLGALITVLVTVLCTLAGWTAIQRWSAELDPLERIGVAGMLGLGALGLLTLFVGLIPGGLNYGLWILLPIFALAMAIRWKESLADFKFQKPEGWLLGGVAVFALMALFGLVAALAPSTTMDWDTIAYHLAVPKLWLQAGQITYVPGIHHSNFPFTFDNLYIWGLKWGDQAGAKAFSWCAFLLGGMFVAGIVRRWSGSAAAGIGLILYSSIPVVVWESGTAYIDGVHGIYAAIGIAYAIEAMLAEAGKKLPGTVWLSALGLGFCLGTKHTGLQVLAGLVFVLGLFVVIRKQKDGLKRLAVISALAVAIAVPWYAKSTIMTGNPVYPFFYGILGGRDWDEWRSMIYTREQKTFGISTQPQDLGYAVLGLAVQPGRFVNPNQTKGGGFPNGGLGFAVLAGGFLLACSGRMKTREKLILGVTGMSLLLWFLLSQQSRYMTIMVLPLTLAVAAAWPNLRLRGVLAGAALVQAVCTLWVLKTMQFDLQIQVVTGKIDRAEYQRQTVGFSRAAEQLNLLGPSAKVALYDTVFGYYLDIPYFWANPGHSMYIPYEEVSTGDEYADAMLERDFTHVFISLSSSPERFFQAIGVADAGIMPYTEDEKAEMSKDLDLKWRYLVADAIQEGRLQFVEQAGGGLIFALSR